MTSPSLPQVPVLTLTLAGDASSVRSVACHWSPLPVERLLTGREVGSVNVLLNATLVLCRHAQCAASAHALAAAQSAGSADSSLMVTVDDEPVDLEAARETLRRWLIDFPSVFGGVWDKPVIAQWARLDSRARMASFCEAQVFGMPAATWLALRESGLAQWAADATTLPARWLHDLRNLPEHSTRPVSVSPANVLQYVDKNAAALLADQSHASYTSYASWPAHADLWNEAEDAASTKPAEYIESSEPAKQTEHAPDLAQALLLARLRRLALFCAHQPHEANLTTGRLRQGEIGIGWARCARGVLVHLARVEQGKVAAYRIIAPTRWNFGPATLLQDALRGLPWAAAQPFAQRLALLLDPCAPYQIKEARDA